MLLTFGLIALCVAFLLPGHYPPWGSFEQEVAAAAGCWLIASARLARPSEGNVAIPPLALLFYACASIPLGQWATGQIHFAVDAVLAAAYLAAFATAMVAGARGSETQRRELADGLGLALIAAGIASTALALAQWLRIGGTLWVIDLPPGGRPFANLAQPNHLSTLLALSTAAVLGRFEQRRLGAVTTALAVAWFGFGIAMTQSRTGWLFVVLLIVWWAMMRRRVGLRLPASAVVGGAAGYVLLAAGWATLSDAMLLSGDTLTERLRPGTRWLHWQTLWDAISRAPWTGYGWQQVGLAQQATALDHPASGEWLEHSHNLLLDLWVWNGVPLGSLIAIGLLVWFCRQLCACRTVGQWALVLGVVAMFLHALLEYPLDYLYFLLPLGLMIGLLHDEARQSAPVRMPTAVLAALLAAQLALLAFVAAEYLQVQESVRHLRFKLMGVVSPSGVPAPPAVSLLDAPRESHRFWLVEARPGMSAAELDQMRAVSQRYPVPATLLRYALAAGLNDRPAEAASFLGLMCKLHSAARCDEGRQAWADLQSRYPELHRIPPPL